MREETGGGLKRETGGLITFFFWKGGLNRGFTVHRWERDLTSGYGYWQKVPRYERYGRTATPTRKYRDKGGMAGLKQKWWRDAWRDRAAVTFRFVNCYFVRNKYQWKYSVLVFCRQRRRSQVEKQSSTRRQNNSGLRSSRQHHVASYWRFDLCFLEVDVIF